MDALNAIIRDVELHRSDLRVKVIGFQQNVKKASFFIAVNNAKKELTLGRSEPYTDWDACEFNKFNILFSGFSLYCLGMTNKLDNGWTCRVERTWGWGYPINMLHHYAVDFIDKWATMSEAEFRQELESRLTADHELSCYARETAVIIDAIVNVLYKVPKGDMSYVVA